MSYSRDADPSIDVERLRFPWKTVVAIVCAVVTVIVAFKAAEMASGKEFAQVKERMSVIETEQRNDDVHRARIQQQLDRLEEKIDRVLLMGRER